MQHVTDSITVKLWFFTSSPGRVATAASEGATDGGKA